MTLESGPLSDARVLAVLKGFVRAKIDPRAGDDENAWAGQYGVSGVPDVQVLAPNGGVLKTLNDYGESTDAAVRYFLDELQPVAAQYPGTR